MQSLAFRLQAVCVLHLTLCQPLPAQEPPGERTQDSPTAAATTKHIETAASVVPASADRVSDRRLQRRIDFLEQSIPRLMREHHVPGAAVTLITDSEVLWSRGFGVRCAGSTEKVQPGTIMEACSMSKPFFAYVVLQLVEDGRFDLDRPLVEYLGTDYESGDPRHREITAHMVLTHTSGLPNWRDGGWTSKNRLTLAFEPGSDFRYSGEGFLMLQRAVEKSLGMDLDELSRKNLIDPLGLKRTSYTWQDPFMLHAACGHDASGAVKSRRNYYDQANAAYTLYTTADDYASFLVEILRRDRSSDHSISEATRTRMLTPFSHRDDQNADWGLGWGIRSRDNEQTVYHSGANGSGFRCYSEFRPRRGDGMVLMTNGVGGKKLWQSLIELAK